MSNLNISIVVPIIPRHHKYAKSLVRNLLNSSVKPVEIIFAASSQTTSSEFELLNLKELTPLNIQVISSREKYTAGENRNRGWEIASGDYVSFCDADDLYSKFRLEIIKNIAIDYSPDLIVHNYTFQKPAPFYNRFPKDLVIVRSSDLFDTTFGGANREVENEFNPHGGSNLILPSGLTGKPRVHHGHCTVKKSLVNRFSNLPFAEDGIFCRDVLADHKDVIWVSAKLSNYERFNLFNIFRNSYLSLLRCLSHSKRRVRAWMTQ